MQGAHKPVKTYPGLEQFICAALCDPNLARLVLVDPNAAADQVMDSIKLSARERELLGSITSAADIHAFAASLHQKTQEDALRPAS